jgi:hypothetical protein
MQGSLGSSPRFRWTQLQKNLSILCLPRFAEEPWMGMAIGFKKPLKHTQLFPFSYHFCAAISRVDTAQPSSSDVSTMLLKFQ